MALIQTCGVTEYTAIASITAGAMVGSLLPDKDHTKSKISNTSVITNVVSTIISVFFSHRGAIHTPIFAVIISVAAYVAMSALAFGLPILLITAAFFLGIISHLVLDSLTPGGIMWLWPVYKKRINIAAIRTNSIMEKAFAGVFAVLIGYMFMN